MTQNVTATDLFCEAGGSSIGLHDAGVDVVVAANHWKLAVDSHNANFPDTDHRVADISQVDPRLFPRTTMLWASPSCTHHSQAAARKLAEQRDLPPEQRVPVEAAERSRATMWDVVRFAEYHQYELISVENVIEVTRWNLFEPWLMALRNLGYDHKVVSLNSAFAGPTPAPQSRDRVYIDFWKNGNPAPDLEFRPLARCTSCDVDVEAIQTWKKRKGGPPIAGRYRQQYLYTCPRCTSVVAPYYQGAFTAIDWSIPGERLGDRKKPLADGTMARIAGGMAKYADHGVIVPLDRNKDPNKRAKSLLEPWPTQTARASMGLAFSPFIAELRGGSSKHRSVKDPLCTVTASGNHHGLVTPPGFVMRNNGSKGDGREHCTPFHEPMRTMTTKGHQSVVTGIRVEDAHFRMLQPHEVGRAMAFPDGYTVKGNKREQVKQYGNAVTPPASSLNVNALVASLTGERIAA